MFEFDIESVQAHIVEKDINFHQCFGEEEQLNKSINEALNKIEAGEQFAFYNLSLSKYEQQVLSNIEIIEFNNVIINSSSLPLALTQAIHDMDGIIMSENDLADVSNIIMSITSTIIGHTGATKFELMLRTRESYADNCIYWHLDKNHAEISGVESSNQELRFIVPLKGIGTNYQPIDSTTRNKFLEISEDAPYYYGHGLQSCSSGDKISNLLNSSEIYKPKLNFGSVHVAGKNGAMHAAPEISESRLLLLITVILKNN